MYRKCCVPKCNSLRQDVKLHQFPTREENRSWWLQCIGSDCEDTKNMYVCHKHFEQRFVNTATNRLKRGAYPTLFTEIEITSGNSSTAVEETVSKTCSVDHTYARKRHIDHSYAQIPKCTQNKVARSEINVTSTMNCPQTAIASSSIVTQVPQATSSITPRKVVRRRLIKSVDTLSPRCKLFYKEYKKARRITNYASRAKKAISFSKQKSLEDLTTKMNPLTKKILWMQINLCAKNKKALRFSLEEKLIALSIYKQGPKSYKFLQKIFILPSKTTLKKLISQLDIDTGINPRIFDHIKQQVESWDYKKKYCTVVYDEMAIETALTYATHKDNIVGFVHLMEKKDKFADHALVFMLRGAVFKWQQPVAFYFCEGATSSLELKNIIKNIIAAVTDTGLVPIALVSDQGTSFQAAINSLLEDTRRQQLNVGDTIDDTIHLNGNSLSIIFDPPHLIKGIRNNLLTKDMMFEGKLVRWNDIVDVYNADCKHGESRILHKLTDQHVIPEKIKKMKVKNCVRVISKSVSAALSYTSAFPFYPDGRPVSHSMKNTAEAIAFFDDLFDSVNGVNTKGKLVKGKNLRKAISARSAHHEFWNDAIKILEGIKFFSKNGSLKSVPSIKNWVITLKSFQRLWNLMASKNVIIMRPRYFNSDIIENFFGQVRAYNYRCNNPNAYAFINTFKSLLMTRFINFHSENFNCEEDASQSILKIKSLFNSNNSAPMADAALMESVSKQTDICKENIQQQATREKINLHSRAYTAGWVTRKILAKVNHCLICKKNLLSTESSTHAFIKEKEFKSMHGKKKLTYPSEYAVISFGYTIKTTNEYLEQYGYTNNISLKIKEKISSKYSFDYLDCNIHKELVAEYFLSISIKLCIFNWCSIINKILKGIDVSRAESSNLGPMQKKALLKFKKKIKNKNVNK